MKRPWSLQICEHALDEVFPETGVRQPPFLLDGQVREAFNEPGRENSSPGFGRDVASVVNLDAFQAAAGGVLLEHVTAEILRFELRDSPLNVGFKLIGQIDGGLDGDQAHTIVGTHKTHRFPRYAEAALHLRADGHPFHKRRKRLGQERVALVAAVEADGLTQQAG